MIINFANGDENSPKEPPIWTYSGTYKTVEDAVICTSGGKFTFSKLNKAQKNGITVILVGGGGGGAGGYGANQQGGTGYAGSVGTKIQKVIHPLKDKEYSISIGGGGSQGSGGHNGNPGGTSIAFELAADGGNGGSVAPGHKRDEYSSARKGYNLYGGTYGSSGGGGDGYAHYHPAKPAEPPGPGGYPPGHPAKPAYYTYETYSGSPGKAGTVIILGLI